MSLNEVNIVNSNKFKKIRMDIKAEKDNFIFNDNIINSNKENENINIINKNNKSINTFENTNKNPIIPNILNEIKYGIDENGNPMNVKEYFKNINNYMKKNKRPIAYIVEDKNNDNILVDLNGNKITEKNKEGDYELPFHFKILIKDFDVKHPELRINGERLYSLEDNKKIEITNNNQEKDENNKDYENITEEISFQIDSTETDENTSQKINRNANNKLNYMYKNYNIFKKKQFMDFLKLRYGNSYSVNNTINGKQINRISKVKNVNYNKRRFNNYSNNKIKTDNNQEYVTRTNSILNINKQLDDNYYNNTNNCSNNKNLTFENLSISQSKNYKNISNKDKGNDIIRDYIFSPIKKINKNNFSTIKNNNIYKKNRIINERILRPNIANNINYNSQKKYKNSLINIPINNSINKYESFSNSIKSPSLENTKRKSKKIFKEFDYNDKHYFYSYTNSSSNDNKYNRIKNHIINKNITIKLERNKENNKIEKLNNYNDDPISKTINKCLSKDNMNNNKENNIYKKEVKKRNNIMVPSSIRSIEYSESSNNELNLINKNEVNDDKLENKHIINKRNKNKLKLIKKIPMAPKKQNQNFNTKNSILTKEANNMIKNYLSKKKINNRKSILKISFLKNQIINKSFSTRKIDKKNNLLEQK